MGSSQCTVAVAIVAMFNCLYIEVREGMVPGAAHKNLCELDP